MPHVLMWNRSAAASLVFRSGPEGKAELAELTFPGLSPVTHTHTAPVETRVSSCVTLSVETLTNDRNKHKKNPTKNFLKTVFKRVI